MGYLEDTIYGKKEDKMYNYKKVEQKWQKHWEENNTYITKIDKNKEKFYIFSLNKLTLVIAFYYYIFY